MACDYAARDFKRFLKVERGLRPASVNLAFGVQSQISYRSSSVAIACAIQLDQLRGSYSHLRPGGLRQLLAPRIRRPQSQTAVQGIQRRQREVDRRRSQPALDLQEPLEVLIRVVARQWIAERISAPAAIPRASELVAEHLDVP